MPSEPEDHIALVTEEICRLNLSVANEGRNLPILASLRISNTKAPTMKLSSPSDF